MKKITFVFICLSFLFIKGANAQNNAQNEESYLLDSCLMNFRFKAGIYQEQNYFKKSQVCGFELFFDYFLLGPSINGFKYERSVLAVFEDSLYPQRESLNRMHIGLAARVNFGHISLGFVNEELYTQLQVSDFFSFSGESGRLGFFVGSDFLFQRESDFISKTRINCLVQFFSKEDSQLKKINLDLYLSINLYDLNLGKICFSPIVGTGTRGSSFEQMYFYEGGIGFSINRSPSKKMRNNFITFSYQRNSLFYDFREEERFFMVKINVDPYYLGMFKDLRK